MTQVIKNTFLVGSLVVGGIAIWIHGRLFGEKEGIDHGRKKAQEEAKAENNELKAKIADLIKKREETISTFRTILEPFFSSVDNPLRKSAELLDEYKQFSIMCVHVAGEAKIRVLEHQITASSCDDLRHLIFGLMELGYPDALISRVNELWGMNDIMEIKLKLNESYPHLSENNRTTLGIIIRNTNDFIFDLAREDEEIADLLRNN